MFGKVFPHNNIFQYRTERGSPYLNSCTERSYPDQETRGFHLPESIFATERKGDTLSRSVFGVTRNKRRGASPNRQQSNCTERKRVTLSRLCFCRTELPGTRDEGLHLTGSNREMNIAKKGTHLPPASFVLFSFDPSPPLLSRGNLIIDERSIYQR